MTSKVRKCVFPAAGLGTRFLPATKAQPKEMLSLVDKPLIQYGVEEAIQSGIQNIVIVTGRGKSAIEDHFDVSFELENLLETKKKTDLLKLVRNISDMIDVAYVRQKEALGLGHAVHRARELIGREPFAVVLSDDVIDSEIPCLRQLLDIHDFFGASVVALMEVPKEQISAYGVVDAEPIDHNGARNRLYRVRNMVEKPRPKTPLRISQSSGVTFSCRRFSSRLRRFRRARAARFSSPTHSNTCCVTAPSTATGLKGSVSTRGTSLGFWKRRSNSRCGAPIWARRFASTSGA